MEHIRIYYANARSLKNKLAELELLVRSCEYDIVAFCETWLDNSVPDALLSHGFYAVIRMDRLDRRGGGVLLLVRRELVYLQATIPEYFADVEAVVVDLLLRDTKLRLAVSYRAPNVTPAISMLHCEFLAFVHHVQHPSLQLGDFNLVVDWNHFYAPGGAAADFVAKVADLSLSQLVSSPTRGFNILDLVLTNDPFPILDCSTAAPFSSSDHDSLFLRLAFRQEHVPVAKCYNFAKANYPAMNIFLANLDWPVLLNTCSDVNATCQTITEILSMAIELFVPVHKGPRFNVPLHIRQLHNKRARLHQELRNGNVGVQREFGVIRNRYKSAVRDWQCFRERRILTSGNPNALYKYAKSRKNYCEAVAPLRDGNGVVCPDNADKCNILAAHYSAVFSQDNQLHYALPLATDKQLSSVQLVPVDVYNILHKMPSKVSMGPDHIPSCVLKNCAVSLALPLCMLYNASLSSGTVPSAWKHAHVVPIFKKGDRAEPSSYRPVSLLSGLDKGLEDPVHHVVLNHCLQENLISSEQFGFLPRRSTTGQLIDCFDLVTKALDNGFCVDVVYLDLSKAFDTISARKLLLKLGSLGISGQLLSWFSSYLTERTQSVKIGEHFSVSCPVLSGVPQGSKLGPLLFLLYIEGIVAAVPCTVFIRLYADDIKLIYIFKKTMQPIEMQSAIVNCVSWLVDRDLVLQAAKCQVFHLGHGNPSYQYTVSGQYVPSAEFVRDLGVLFDKELKFSRHCSVLANKASSVANMILRVFSSRDCTLLMRAFKTYVRPILEYACEVVNPYLVRDVETLECVQRNYTRRVALRTGMEYTDYPDRLRKLEVSLLSDRRDNACIAMYYKLLNGLNHVCHDILPLDDNPRKLRRHNSRNLVLEKCNRECRKNFFSCRYRSTWNALPEDIVRAPSLPSIKRKLSTLVP